MNFNKHLDLEGKHALFSPSQPAWLRYDSDKIARTHINRNRTILGTELHEFVRSQIELRQKASSVKQLINDASTYIFSKYNEKDQKDQKDQKNQLNYGRSLIYSLKDLPKYVFENLKIFINDAIGYKMSSEQIIKYSNHIFGTTDAISFRNNLLRIHDLKTGEGKTHMDQLLIYAALFCLEYKIKPADIDIELRIYQHAEILCYNPTVSDIVPIMDKITTSDKIIMDIKKEEDM